MLLGDPLLTEGDKRAPSSHGGGVSSTCTRAQMVRTVALNSQLQKAVLHPLPATRPASQLHLGMCHHKARAALGLLDAKRQRNRKQQRQQLQGGRALRQADTLWPVSWATGCSTQIQRLKERKCHVVITVQEGTCMIPVHLVTHGVFLCSCCSGHSETEEFQGDPDFLPNLR